MDPACLEARHRVERDRGLHENLHPSVRRGPAAMAGV